MGVDPASAVGLGEYIAELINPLTGEAAAPGERGELDITNLGRWGFPVILYRTADLVHGNLDRCNCGRNSRRFEGGNGKKLA